MCSIISNKHIDIAPVIHSHRDAYTDNPISYCRNSYLTRHKVRTTHAEVTGNCIFHTQISHQMKANMIHWVMNYRMKRAQPYETRKPPLDIECSILALAEWSREYLALTRKV